MPLLAGGHRLRLVIGACLVGTLALLYAPVVDFDFVALDDPLHVTENRDVKAGLSAPSVRSAFAGFHAGYWIPLTWVSHMLDVELFGLEAGGHHATNVALHALNALILFLLLDRWTRAPWQSAFAAALFALHPLRVESVAWVTERKDVLSTLFGLASLAAYVEFARGRGRRFAGLAALALALSLMAKPMLVTLPAVYLLLDFWPLDRLRRASDLKRLVLEKLPFLLIALVFAVLTYVAQREAGAQSDLGPRADAAIPLLLRLANACVSAVRYLGMFVWPADLSAFYPHPYLPGGEPWRGWQVAGAAALLVALTALLLGAARQRGYLATGWLWYLGTLVPVIGLVQTGEQAMADRFTYVPAIGLCIALAWAAGDALGALAGARTRASVAAALAFAALIPLAAVARLQLAHWQDSDHLYRQALRAAAPNPLIHTYYANWLHGRGRVDEAIAQHEAAAEVTAYAAVAHINLGIIAAERERTQDAIGHYRQAAELAPGHADTHAALAGQLVVAGRDRAAVRQYLRVLQLQPRRIEALLALARLRTHSEDPSVRDPEEAVRIATLAMRLDGKRSPRPVEALAAAYAAAGRRGPARIALHDALALAEAQGNEQASERIRGELARLSLR